MTIIVRQTTEFISSTQEEHAVCLANAQSVSPPGGVEVSVEEDAPNKTVILALIAEQVLPP